MSRRRFLLLFIAFDLLCVGAVLAWLATRTTPSPQPGPPALAAVAPAPATLAAPAPAAAAASAEPPPTVPEAGLPIADEGKLELHGIMRGERFWVRVLPADARGLRQTWLVYAPPTPETLGGTVLTDCPILVLDRHLRLVQWNDRDHSSRVVSTAEPAGYRVEREIEKAREDGTKGFGTMMRAITTVPAWELRTAPALLPLVWKAGGSGRVRLVDVFGPRSREAPFLTWSAGVVDLGGEQLVPTAAEDGSLSELRDAAGTLVLKVLGRL